MPSVSRRFCLLPKEKHMEGFDGTFLFVSMTAAICSQCSASAAVFSKCYAKQGSTSATHHKIQ